MYVPNKMWNQIAIVIMVTLTLSPYGHKYVISMTDYFSKYPELTPLKDKSAIELSYHLYKLICHFRCLDIIIYDSVNDQLLSSKYHQAISLIHQVDTLGLTC